MYLLWNFNTASVNILIIAQLIHGKFDNKMKINQNAENLAKKPVQVFAGLRLAFSHSLRLF